MNEESLLEQVLLLALLKKEENESVEDVAKMLEDSKAMSFNESKVIIERLEQEGAIVQGKLSFLGIAMANEAKRNFTLEK